MRPGHHQHQPRGHSRPGRCGVVERTCWPRLADWCCQTYCGIREVDIWATVQEHERLVHWVISRISVPPTVSYEEMVSEGMVALHGAVLRWRPEQGSLAHYAMRVIRWRLVDYLHQSGEEIFECPELSCNPDQEERVALAEQLRCVERAMSTALSHRQRTVLGLWCRGVGHAEIGRRVGCCETTARREARSAMEAVRIEVSRDGTI